MTKMTITEASSKMRELVGDKLDIRTQMELIDLFAATNLAGWEEGKNFMLKIYAKHHTLEIFKPH